MLRTDSSRQTRFADLDWTKAPAHLTSGRLLAGNAVWNVIGTCSPIVVALICVPLLKRGLGTERLGLISLAWVIVGYFGLFDMGLSRALTKLVAEHLGRNDRETIPSLVWTSLALMGAIGLAGFVIALAFSKITVVHLLRVSPILQHEALISFYWLSVSVPFIVLTAGMRGVLEALQRFRLASMIRIPMGIFTYGGPALVLPFSHSLIAVMAALTFGRVLGCLAHVWACMHAFPHLLGAGYFRRSYIAPLVRFGGWMTVSNIVGPFMVSFDRFLIGSMISATAVAYYAVPFEVVSRLGFLPAALVGVLFPAFSTAIEFDHKRLLFLYECGVKYIFVLLFPITLLLIAFAPEGLHYWLGTEFSRNSTYVVQILAFAVFINGLGQIPYAHVQASGRPDITAKLHLVELPLYFAALVYCARHWGITGVAAAWMFRVAFDSALLFLVSWRILPQNRFILVKFPLLMVGAVTAFVYAASSIAGEQRLVSCLLFSLVASYAMWHWMISSREKSVIVSSLGIHPPRPGQGENHV